jgi:hypothetical protein
VKTLKLLLPLDAVVLAVVTVLAAEKKATKTAGCCDGSAFFRCIQPRNRTS